MKKVHDNSNPELKTQLRLHALDHIQTPHYCLDLYCGQEGEMYKRVWCNCDTYLGVDKHPHTLAPTIKMDNQQAIKKADLSKYNIFDLDAYTSPWALMEYILKHKSTPAKSKYLVTFTSGEFRGLFKNTNSYVRIATNTQKLSQTGFLSNHHLYVIQLCISELISRTHKTVSKCGIIMNKRPGLSEPVYGYIIVSGM